MAADLHIHVYEGIDESDMAQFFSNSMGSKWFNPVTNSTSQPGWERVAHTPGIWIGEVSWLKAMLFEDNEKFVPNPVAEISELIGEDLPELTEELAQKIRFALQRANQTSYSIRSVDDKLEAFFAEHMGKKLFTISW